MELDATGRAWAWVAHLRSGGVVPWAEYDGHTAPPRGQLPGAAQLEVVRLLNRRAGETSPRHATLVEHVLATSGPGRGQPDLALVGVDDGAGFGPPPVDPAQLPGAELLRIAVGVLADLLVQNPVDASDRTRRPRARPWHRDYQLTGDHFLADATREALLRSGHVPGLRAPVAVVLADDFATMLSDLWTWRILRGGTIRWPRWLDDWERQDVPPPRMDLVRIAANQARLTGPSRVHIAAGASPASVAALVGAPERALGEIPRFSPDAVELVRQTNLVLRVLAPARERQLLLDRTLVPLLADERGPQRVVLARHDDWVRRQAERMRDELRVAGYPVVGDLDVLVPGESLPGTRPTSAGVLDVALRTLLRFKELAL